MSVKTLLRKTPLYDFTYRSYIYVFKPGYWNQLRAIRDLYANFVRPNSLVFDIGANVGVNTQCFLDLGARVIAVEPVPQNLERLRQIHSRRLTVLPLAVSDKEGQATMDVGDTTDFSTMSPEWKEIAKKSDRFKGESWSKTITVLTTTLDFLIARLGKPAVIKMDVEGFESTALDGLSALPCPLIFEFNAEHISATWQCLDKPCFPPDAEFNFVLENKLVLKNWVSREELKRLLRGTAGDVIVRPR